MGKASTAIDRLMDNRPYGNLILLIEFFQAETISTIVELNHLDFSKTFGEKAEVGTTQR